MVVTENLKTCIGCSKDLPLSTYHQKGKYLESRCKSCISKRKKNNYLRKKKVKIDSFINTSVKVFRYTKDIIESDLVSLLESCLLEEFRNEQRVG